MIEVPVRVKDALRDGRRLKNYIFKVLNDDNSVDFVIDNDTLVKESVKIDERMCTGNQLKFGLCEGSSLEFQYFNHPNITGRQIQAFIDVQFVDENGDLDWYEIPMGFFTVDQCPMQFSTGIRKVTAYNKLKSAYLDEKANARIDEVVDVGITGRTGSASIATILDGLMDGYAIDREDKDCVLSFLMDIDPDCSYFDSTEFSPGYNCVAYISVDLRNVEDASKYKNYKIDMNCKKFYEKVCSYVPQHIYNKNCRELYYDSDQQKWVYRNWGTINDRLKGDNPTGSATYTPIVMEATFYYDTSHHFHWNINKENKDNDEIISTGWYTEEGNFQFPNRFSWFRTIPIYWKEAYWDYTAPNPGAPQVTWTDEDKEIARARIMELFYDPEIITVKEQAQSTIEQMIFTEEQVETWADVTLRELQSAVYEMNCQYGQMDRLTNLFYGATLNNSRLLPSDTLYPSDSLYPNGNSVRGNRSMYSKLWTDSQGVQTFRYLIITYKGLDENNQEVEKVLQRTVNADGTTDYNMSDNWLFKNLVWTDSDVGDYADAMVLKMQSVSWFPFEMWCAGLPYLETGDELEITTSEGTYTSYVLQRQLNGIQNLQDTFIDGELDIF